MSNQDNIIYNVRERPLSTDQNNTESLQARTLAESMLYQMAGLSAVDGTSVLRSVVLGGLAVVPNGNNVDVTAGVLFQNSATLSPTPSTYDSNNRYGRNASSTTLTMASPASDTYYIIEAQVSAVTTSTVSRDILDPTSGTFIASLVPKVQEFHIAFQIVAGVVGGAVPSPSFGDWIALAVVRRPAGGGAVSASDIHDVRPLYSNMVDRHTVGVAGETDVFTSAAQNNLVTLRTVRPSQIGNAGTVQINHANLDVTQAAFLETGLTLAANTLYHLYLCSWHYLTPTQPQSGSNFIQRGILVLSSALPTRGTYNDIISASGINLPAPWSVTTSNDQCVWVGCVRRNATNTGWLGQYTSSPRVQHAIDADISESIPSGTAPKSVTADLTGWVPSIARSARIRIAVQVSTTLNSFFELFDTTNTQLYSTVTAPTLAAVGPMEAFFDVPISLLGVLQFNLTRLLGDTSNPNQITLISWSY